MWKVQLGYPLTLVGCGSSLLQIPDFLIIQEGFTFPRPRVSSKTGTTGARPEDAAKREVICVCPCQFWDPVNSPALGEPIFWYMGQWGGGSLKIKDHFLLPRNSFLSHGVKLYSRAINKPCWGRGWWPEIPDCKVHSARGGRSYRALPWAGQEKNRRMEQLLATLPHRGCTK